MHQRIIHRHVNVSWKAYVYDETIYITCARARFAGCTYLRHIILALNTVYEGKWEGVGPLKLSLLGPVKWHQTDRRVPFGAQKT
jgi:hypothetical protein